jgi:hypothetical protein
MGWALLTCFDGPWFITHANNFLEAGEHVVDEAARERGRSGYRL